MAELIVIGKGLYYGGQTLKVGERFEATDIDAGYLKKTRRAADPPVDPAPVRKVATVQPRALIAEPEPDAAASAEAFAGEAASTAADETTAAEPAPGPKTNRYRTRRLKSED